MRMIPITAVAALAIMTGVASAQNSTTPTPTTTPMSPRSTEPRAAAPAAPRPVAQNPLSQEDLANIDGTTVYGSDDKKIGNVSTVLMEPQSKKIDRLVVTSGGVLGVGGHRVAIPVDQFSWDAEKGAFKLQTTVADIKNKPEWVEGAQTPIATGSSRSSEAPRNNSIIPPTGAGDSESKNR
jgi:sporulation protein YlmC with PRC-barrel domain